MDEEKIKEVFSDEAFVKSFLAMKTPEEAQAALTEKGIDVTVDDLKAFAKLMKKRADGELKDTDLESVAGGSLFAGIMIGLGALCETALGVAGGALWAWASESN